MPHYLKVLGIVLIIPVNGMLMACRWPMGLIAPTTSRTKGVFYPKVHWKDDAPLPEVAADANFYATTAIADHAIECLREHAAEYPDRPFFHYVAFTAPHFPLHARGGYAGLPTSV